MEKILDKEKSRKKQSTEDSFGSLSIEHMQESTNSNYDANKADSSVTGGQTDTGDSDSDL
jgi:hypothetical protein